MPTEITAQDGHQISQNTPVAITGCGAVKGATIKKLTLAQQLNRALRACRTKYRHNKHRRQACERKAHSHYTAKALAACRKTHKHNRKRRRTCEAQARRKYAAHPARHKRH